jgi:GNAT superfamily N-acetyltransferase
MVTIKEVGFAAVQRYAENALKERVKILDYGPQMRWFQILLGRVPIGCLGLLPTAEVTFLKGVYVISEMRGRGFGTLATEAVLALAEGPVEAAALNPSWYHVRGFTTIAHNEHDIAIVRREPVK